MMVMVFGRRRKEEEEEKLKNDLANYKITQDEQELNDFAFEQLTSIEGWK